MNGELLKLVESTNKKLQRKTQLKEFYNQHDRDANTPEPDDRYWDEQDKQDEYIKNYDSLNDLYQDDDRGTFRKIYPEWLKIHGNKLLNIQNPDEHNFPIFLLRGYDENLIKKWEQKWKKRFPVDTSGDEPNEPRGWA